MFFVLNLNMKNEILDSILFNFFISVCIFRTQFPRMHIHTYIHIYIYISCLLYIYFFFTMEDNVSMQKLLKFVKETNLDEGCLSN